MLSHKGLQCPITCSPHLSPKVFRQSRKQPWQPDAQPCIWRTATAEDVRPQQSSHDTSPTCGAAWAQLPRIRGSDWPYGFSTPKLFLGGKAPYLTTQTVPKDKTGFQRCEKDPITAEELLAV